MTIGVETRVCVKCAAALPPLSGVGRPQQYCSTACRRVGEYEIRRVQRRLIQLEDDLQREGHCRLALRDMLGRDLVQRVADLQADIATNEARLRALIDGDAIEPER